METHVADMVVHLPTHQHSFLLAFSTHERMASIAQNIDTDAHSRTINGCFLT